MEATGAPPVSRVAVWELGIQADAVAIQADPGKAEGAKEEPSLLAGHARDLGYQVRRRVGRAATALADQVAVGGDCEVEPGRPISPAETLNRPRGRSRDPRPS
jgi:hypothetical protein